METIVCGEGLATEFPEIPESEAIGWTLMGAEMPEARIFFLVRVNKRQDLIFNQDRPDFGCVWLRVEVGQQAS